MPLLWRDAIIGWANATHSKGELKVTTGYVQKPPEDDQFVAELEAEIGRLKLFLEGRYEIFPGLKRV
jgi:uncharacterized protein YcaQ